MKRKLLGLILFLCLFAVSAFADKARFLSSDGNSNYHVNHLESHIGLIDCRISGNYLKVRTAAGGSNVLGHVEQADTIELIQVSGNWAQIRVTYSAPTSPDSWTGLQGWVDADYVECPCDNATYYGNRFSGSYPDGVTNASGVAVRELAGTNQRSLFTLNYGAQVVILGEYSGTGGWFYRILTEDGKTGFVLQSQINYTGSYSVPYAAEGLPSKGGIGADPGTPTYIPAGALMGTLLHDSTNVRASANGNVIGRLRKNAQVAVLSTTTDSSGTLWYYVSYGNDQRGYIRADLVEIQQQAYTPVVTAAPVTAVPYQPAVTAVPYQPVVTAVPTQQPVVTVAPASPAAQNYASTYNMFLSSNWNSSQIGTQSPVMRDIDADGVPELFVWANLGVRGAVCIYTYSNGYVIPLNVEYQKGDSISNAGVDKDTNVIGGSGTVFYSNTGAGILAGGADSASTSSYTYYIKLGYAMVPLRTFSVTYYQNGNATYMLDGVSVSQSEAQAFLSCFANAVTLLTNW